MELNRSINFLFRILHVFKKSMSCSTYLFFRLTIHTQVFFRCCDFQNVIFDGSRFLLLLGSLVLFDFVFTNTDCGECHTSVRATVSQVSELIISTKIYIIYQGCARDLPRMR